MDRRLGIDLKFERARNIHTELVRAVNAWGMTNPFSHTESEDPDTGDLVLHVSIREHPPVEWSILVGDIVHNARSALDHLAQALVEKNGGRTTTETAFPVANQESEYDALANKRLRGASADDRDAVRALRPWRGTGHWPWHNGDLWLWPLHRLDIIDKHRLLVPVVSVQSGTDITITHPPDVEPALPPSAPPRVKPLPAVEDGAEVYRVPKAFREQQDPRSHYRYGLIFAPALGDIVPGQRIVESLGNMLIHLSSKVEPLVASL